MVKVNLPSPKTFFNLVFRPTPIPKKYQTKFELENKRQNLHACRVLSFLACTLIPGSVVFDWLIVPEYVKPFFIIRLIMTFLCLFCFFLSQKPNFESHGEKISMISIITVGIGHSIFLRLLGFDHPYYAIMNLIYLAAMVVPWSFTKTLTACLINFSTYLIPILIWDLKDINYALLFNNAGFQFETIFIACVVSFFQDQKRKDTIIKNLIISDQNTQLSKSYTQIKESELVKTRFLSSITHELKTPLSVIIGHSEIINEVLGECYPEVKTQLALIQQSAMQLSLHVDRLISVSKIADPRDRLDLDVYNYSGIIKATFPIFQQKAIDLGINYTIDQPTMPLLIECDLIKIEEVLMNLIQNAFKFTPEKGSIHIRVYCDTTNIITEISDTGIGIAQDDIPKIFEHLFQVEKEVLTRKHGGQGIGLFLVKQNVKSHGGEIFVQSKKGEGTVFRFYLPLYFNQEADFKNQDYEGPDRRKQRDRRKGDRRAGGDRRNTDRIRRFEYQQNLAIETLAKKSAFLDDIEELENKKIGLPGILIVEDDPGMQSVILNGLYSEYNLFIAKDGNEAIEKLKQYPTDISLIISDIMMPNKSGFDFLNDIKKDERFHHIPFIFLTALNDQKDQIKGIQMGATDYIVKPYNIKILKEKAMHWLSRREHEKLLLGLVNQLEYQNEENSKLREIISHEIRNPLQVLNGVNHYLEQLRNEFMPKSNEQEKKWWERTKRISKGIESIFNILQTTKDLESIQFSQRREESVRELFDETLHMIKDSFDDIKFETIIDDNVDQELKIQCDKKMLNQVFFNLLKNATEAIHLKENEKDGKVKILIHQNCAHLSIRVEDNGMGIPEEHLDNLFTYKFTTKKDGTGIGLHLSRRILKLHGGNIKAESKSGAGSAFIISLPLSTEPTPQKS